MPPIGFVYVAEALGKGEGLTKIGYSVTPWTRLDLLERETGWPIRLVGVIHDATYREERLLHRAFVDRQHDGEWYRLRPADRRFLDRLIDRDASERCRMRRAGLSTGLSTE